MAKVGFWLQGATGKLAGSKLQGGMNGTIIATITAKTNSHHKNRRTSWPSSPNSAPPTASASTTTSRPGTSGKLSVILGFLRF